MKVYNRVPPPPLFFLTNNLHYNINNLLINILKTFIFLRYVHCTMYIVHIKWPCLMQFRTRAWRRAHVNHYTSTTIRIWMRTNNRSLLSWRSDHQISPNYKFSAPFSTTTSGLNICETFPHAPPSPYATPHPYTGNL